MKYQQGDVLIKSCEEVKGEELNHLILAEGEYTGHSHRIIEGMAKLVLYKNLLYLKVISKQAKLFHDEHKEIILPTGFYKIDRVREYDHFEEEARRIID